MGIKLLSCRVNIMNTSWLIFEYNTIRFASLANATLQFAINSSLAIIFELCTFPPTLYIRSHFVLYTIINGLTHTYLHKLRICSCFSKWKTHKKLRLTPRSCSNWWVRRVMLVLKLTWGAQYVHAHYRTLYEAMSVRFEGTFYTSLLKEENCLVLGECIKVSCP